MGSAWITSGSPQSDSSSSDVKDLYKSNDVYINGVKVVLYGQAMSSGQMGGIDGAFSEVAVSAPPERADALLNLPVSPKVTVPDVNMAFIQSQVSSYVANPTRYMNSAAAANGVKPAFVGNIDSGPPPDGIQPTTAIASDIVPFLQQTLDEAAKGMWRESGQGGNPSNPNIVGIWKNLGIGTGSPWNTDQTAWCMGFVNFALKSSGYKYVQTASAKAIGSSPTKWNATQVDVSQAQPGDIVLWNFSHVNFIYTAGSGGVGPPFTFVGGNQTPTAGRNNNPDDGDVSISWKSGWTAARGGIAGIYRPSKV